MKGTPTTYNKDFQECWELLFETVDTLSDCVGIATGVLSTLKINEERMRSGLTADMLATDLAEYLVRKVWPLFALLITQPYSEDGIHPVVSTLPVLWSQTTCSLLNWPDTSCKVCVICTVRMHVTDCSTRITVSASSIPGRVPSVSAPGTLSETVLASSAFDISQTQKAGNVTPGVLPYHPVFSTASPLLLCIVPLQNNRRCSGAGITRH